MQPSILDINVIIHFTCFLENTSEKSKLISISSHDKGGIIIAIREGR